MLSYLGLPATLVLLVERHYFVHRLSPTLCLANCDRYDQKNGSARNQLLQHPQAKSRIAFSSAIIAAASTV
jgi:hypothetical protein